MTTLARTEPRVVLRRLHGVVTGSGSAQDRLNRIVTVIAEDMAADVCSVYLFRGGMLELFATEGLNKDAVHRTTLKMGEGLVGLIAEHARPFALSEASRHPNFAFRPETGEEAYHSLMGVPILRGGRVVGVLVAQNRTSRDYRDDEIETMQTVAMILAEMVGGGGLLDGGDASERFSPDGAPQRLTGLTLSDGLCRGTVVMHRPRVIVEHHVADDTSREHGRLGNALAALREQVEGILQDATADASGDSKEILETYRMFARDRGWIARMREEIEKGLTAEAAVERVQVDTRARMSEISDPYLRERLYDLEDLSNRMLRHLTGQNNLRDLPNLPENAILVARNMGPAELLDYDRERVVGLLLEDGSPTSHVAIVAKALQLPVIGRIERLLDVVEPGDTVLVDAEHGQLFVRPNDNVIQAFSEY